MSDETIVLIENENKTLYKLSQIYDPDTDITTADKEGKYIPEVNNLVIDDEVNIGVLYRVSVVNPTTKKVTLEPARIMVDSVDEEHDLVVSFSNDQFMLFYDTRISPTKINIDSKLVLYGSNNKKFRLVKKNEDDTYTSISVYITSTGDISGDMIPLESIDGYPAIKRCTNCHTLESLTEGNEYELEVYDSTSILVGRIRLIAKKSNIMNDLVSAYNPIVDFVATCGQMQGDYFVIYEDQDPSRLNIDLQLVYADGTVESIVIDGSTCTVDGLYDFIPAYPGHKQTILFRYFLTPKQPSPIAQEVADEKFITLEKIIIVEAKMIAQSVKLSFVPVWNTTTSSYTAKFFAYSGSKDRVMDVTSYVSFVDDTTFNGSDFNNIQEFEVTFDPAILYPDDTEATPHQQVFWVRLREFTAAEPWVFKDGANALLAYGTNTDTLPRPIIKYNSDDQNYYIPSQMFTTEDMFLEAFYINASPLYDSGQQVTPTTPTHFTLRKASTGEVLLSNPIAVENYITAFTVTNVSTAAELINSTVIVEFLEEVSGEYNILYGAPVIVKQA